MNPLYIFLSWWATGGIALILSCYMDNEEFLVKQIPIFLLASLFGPLLLLLLLDTNQWRAFINKPLLRKRK